ncbi:MAG: OB-fold protein [Clostridium sp.]
MKKIIIAGIITSLMSFQITAYKMEPMTLKQVVMMQYNEVKYNRTKNKEIVVETTVSNIDREEDEVTIRAIEDYNIMRGEFEFEKENIEGLQEVKKGDKVVIKGIFKGVEDTFLGLVVNMENCTLEKIQE